MLYVHGVGHFHPETVIDNAFLESLDIGVDIDWILQRVGIHTRRSVLPLDYIRHTRNRDPRAASEASQYGNPQTGAAAARMALERAGLEPSAIGMVISGGCSPELSIPAEASRVAAELGISVPAFDLSAACSSFALQMHFLRGMQPEALPDFILIVNPENTTRTVDYSDRSTAVLWGDGSSAAVVSPRVPGRARVRVTSYESDPTGWDKVVIPVGGHFKQQGAAVQTFAIKKTLATLEALRRWAGEEFETISFVGHQANLTMLRSVCSRAGLAAERHFFNVDRFGNCGAAGAPTVLSQRWDEFVRGARVALAVVGSGLAWGGMLFEFDGPEART